MRFVCTHSDPGIYVHFHGQDIIILVIYIDDSFFISFNKSYLKFKKKQQIVGNLEILMKQQNILACGSPEIMQNALKS